MGHLPVHDVTSSLKTIQIQILCVIYFQDNLSYLYQRNPNFMKVFQYRSTKTKIPLGGGYPIHFWGLSILVSILVSEVLKCMKIIILQLFSDTVWGSGLLFVYHNCTTIQLLFVYHNCTTSTTTYETKAYAKN